MMQSFVISVTITHAIHTGGLRPAASAGREPDAKLTPR